MRGAFSNSERFYNKWGSHEALKGALKEGDEETPGRCRFGLTGGPQEATVERQGIMLVRGTL